MIFSMINNLFSFTLSLITGHFFLSTFSNFSELSIWYLLHCLANLYITALSIEPIYYILEDPIYHIQNITPFYDTICIILILHVYHMMAFYCTKSDIFHHICFVGIGSFTIFIFENGYYSALAHFFICGFPGAIDYLFLFLYQEGYIEKNQRLKIAVFVNLWIRSPGLIATSTFSIIKYIYSKKTLLNLIEMVFQVTTTFFNGQTYLRDVIYASGKNDIYNEK
jgi:hypothetical protein